MGAQVLGSMLVYPNRMSFDIMPNGGQPPAPKGLLHIKVLDVDVASGGLPIPHLHKARPPDLLDLASGDLPISPPAHEGRTKGLLYWAVGVPGTAS